MSILSGTCPFCEEFANPNYQPDRKIWENDDFILLPSLGSFTPGYLLLMPKIHIKSYATLSQKELTMALDIVECTREVVSREFGPVILAEHGVGKPGLRSSACCEHAHWHLIPCDPWKVSAEYDRTAGRPAILQDIGDLCSWNGKSYLFLSPLKHVFWVWDQSEQFTSQFIRQVCARTMGIDEFYDWALFPFADNMIITKQKLTAPLCSAIPNTVSKCVTTHLLNGGIKNLDER
jgi:diadenosine tetraphosphate (Ap4A) HIT family hydrolase